MSYLDMARFISIRVFRSSFCCCRTWTFSSRNTFFWACSKVEQNQSAIFHSPDTVTVMCIQTTVHVCVRVAVLGLIRLIEPTTFSRSEIFFSCWCICRFFISTTSFKLFRSCSMCWYGAKASCYRNEKDRAIMEFRKIKLTLSECNF